MRLDRLAPLGLLLLGGLVGCPAEPESVSQKARVMPKGGAVWGRDLATGLGLQDWELCAELGGYDCIGEAHLITLGGVEPAVLGIDEPLASASVSAPIAVDRVAVSACAERYERDVAGPAVVFGPVLELDAKDRREAVAKLLVQRLLAREPKADEIAAIVDLYDQMAPESAEPARDWSVGACVMVATSTEALFY